MKTLYLHIGTHKTGSTSLQRWLLEHEALLRDQGFALYRGRHIPQNHIELYLAAMRYERDSFGKQSMPEVIIDEAYTESVRREVQNAIANCPLEKIIMTTEGLSLLRHPDELETLCKILGPCCENARLILYLRNRTDFLESYRAQLRKRKGRLPSEDYWSALYVEDDTWLVDYDQLLAAFGHRFGRDSITVIDYDNEIDKSDNIIPSFIDAIGLDQSRLSLGDVNAYRDNKTLERGPAYGTTAVICGAWFLLTGWNWTFLINLGVAYPVGLCGLYMWTQARRVSPTDKKNTVAIALLGLGLASSLVALLLFK